MKTIGVLGGLGPQATMDFVARVHRAAQEQIPAHWNSGYPGLVVHYHRAPPMKVAPDMKPLDVFEPSPALLEAARWLGERADFLTIPSNTPHLFRSEIEEASGCKVLDMMELVVEEVQRRHWKSVGVLEIAEPKAYPPLLVKHGVHFETADPEFWPALEGAVRTVMEGRDNQESRMIALSALSNVRAKSVDGTILGCTEIPLLLRADNSWEDVINPAELLAETAVRMAAQG